MACVNEVSPSPWTEGIKLWSLAVWYSLAAEAPARSSGNRGSSV